MSLEKIRKLREQVHELINRDQSIHYPLHNLSRALEKIFTDEKEIETTRSAAKHARSKSEYRAQFARYKNALKSRRSTEKAFFKYKKIFLKKWDKLKKAQPFRRSWF